MLKNQITQDLHKKGNLRNIKLIEIPFLDIGGGDTRDPIGDVRSRNQAI